MPDVTAAALNIVLFCHPQFMHSQSMPRFAQMLRSAYEARGHQVEIWSPAARAFNWVPRGRLSKWAGYIDQYLLFPLSVRRSLKQVPLDTLFVFCDQALGPWVPLVADRPHVVHAHDLLALRSALGFEPQNPTSLTGRLYQRYIRRGYRRARNFISISYKTRDDLHRYGQVTGAISEVVYNGMNFPFEPIESAEALRLLRAAELPADPQGMLLHVGGGQWYKNLTGVIQLYACYAAATPDPLPLWCISPPPGAAVNHVLARVPSQGKVLFFQNLTDTTLQAAYSNAKALLFPSLAEGFGWPLIESQACGCPVITTDEPPMNEVAGKEARYLPRLQFQDDLEAWGSRAAVVLQELLARSPWERAGAAERGRAWASRFRADDAIDSYLRIYQRVLSASVSSPTSYASPELPVEP